MARSKRFCLGFTLLEILIAIFIFAIIATITSAVLRSVILQHEIFHAHFNSFKQMTFAIEQINNDFQSVINQPVYRDDGQLEPALIATPNSLSFTVLSQVSTPTLLRVQYEKHGYLLIRRVFAVNHFVIDKQLSQAELFSSLDYLQFSYLSYGKGFSENWPPSSLGNKALNNLPIPRAIKLNIVLQGQGSVELLIDLPTTDLPIKNN